MLKRHTAPGDNLSPDDCQQLARLARSANVDRDRLPAFLEKTRSETYEPLSQVEPVDLMSDEISIEIRLAPLLPGERRPNSPPQASSPIYRGDTAKFASLRLAEAGRAEVPAQIQSVGPESPMDSNRKFFQRSRGEKLQDLRKRAFVLCKEGVAALV